MKLKNKEITKRIICLFFSFLMLLTFSVTVYADNADQQQSEEFNEAMEEIEAEIEKGIDEDIYGELSESGIEITNPESITRMKTGDIFDKIINVFSMNIGQAMKIAAKIIALILICTIVKSYVPESFSVSKTFSVVSVVCASTVIISSLEECMQSVIGALESIKTFMTCYIPVYASVIMTGGSVTAGTSYYVVLFSLCEIITFLAGSFILPVMSIVLSLSIVGAINPDLSFLSISNSFKKLVQWILSGTMTIIVAVLSIQSIIGVSSDTVASKTVKFAVSTFVPIVGGAVSDAYSTVKSSVGIIRSGIGGIGIIVVLFISISPIVSTAVIKLSVHLCQIIADIFGEKSISALMGSISSMLSICLSTIICVSVAFIISTALLMLLGTNLT